jgi:hypothetical protein
MFPYPGVYDPPSTPVERVYWPEPVRRYLGGWRSLPPVETDEPSLIEEPFEDAVAMSFEDAASFEDAVVEDAAVAESFEDAVEDAVEGALSAEESLFALQALAVPETFVPGYPKE